MAAKIRHALSNYIREFLLPRATVQHEYKEYAKVKNLTASAQGSSGARIDIFKAQVADLASGSPQQKIQVRYAGCSVSYLPFADRWCACMCKV